MRHRTPGLAAALICLLLGAASVPAQEAATPAAATPATAQSIPTAEIPARADADERFARAITERALEADLSGRWTPSLEAIDRATQQLSATMDPKELRLLPAMRLESLTRHWAFYERSLGEWRRGLQRDSNVLSGDAAEVARRRAEWAATRDAGRDDALASPLHRRVDAVLAQLVEADRALSRPLEEDARLAGRASAIEARIAAAEAGVAGAIAANDERLFRLGLPPLWRLSEQPRRSRDAAASARAGVAIEVNFLREYAAANLDRLAIHGIAVALLLPLLFWLSRRSRELLQDDEDLRASSGMLLRPVSSWLVLSLMSVLLIEPDAPILVHELVFVLALVPVLRILPRRVFDLLGPWPYAATALYLLDRLGFLFVGHPLNHRLFLLVLTLLTLATLAWLLATRRGTAGSGRLGRLVRLAGWSSVGGLLVSAAANAIGNVTLAAVITGGVLDSGYSGLALFAGVGVVGALLRLLAARPRVASMAIMARHSRSLLQGAGRLVALAAFAVWLAVTLSSFRLLRPATAWLSAVLTHSIEAGRLSITLGGVLMFLLSVYLALWLARSIRIVLQESVLPRMALPRGVGSSIASLTYYALVLLGFMVALAVAGFEVSQLAIVFGALGVGIGFGLQNVVNNFVSGLILMFERPIRPGDVVEVSGTSGRVREIGMRATTLTTFEGADVVVPNGALLNEKLINWTLSDMTRRIDVNVGVAYGTDPTRVIELLREVTRETPGIVTSPEPLVLFNGFGASSLDFVVRAWTGDFGESIAIRSHLTVRVHDALVAAGVEIPFPQQDLHLRSISSAAGALFAGRQDVASAAPGTAAAPAGTT